MPVRVSLVPVPDIDRIWGHVAEGLAKACLRSGGDLTVDYLWTECRSSRAFLVIVTEGDEVLASSVWRFEKWTTGKKLRCLMLYGTRMKDWLADHKEFARQMAIVGEATSFVTEGRKGFERLFPDARIVRQLYEETV